MHEVRVGVVLLKGVFRARHSLQPLVPCPDEVLMEVEPRLHALHPVHIMSLYGNGVFTVGPCLQFYDGV